MYKVGDGVRYYPSVTFSDPIGGEILEVISVIGKDGEIKYAYVIVDLGGKKSWGVSEKFIVERIEVFSDEQLKICDLEKEIEQLKSENLRLKKRAELFELFNKQQKSDNRIIYRIPIDKRCSFWEG